MIGKIPKAGRGFKGLVSYLMHGAREPKRQHATQPDLQNDTGQQTNARTGERTNATNNRVVWTETHNLITSDPMQAVRIMRATANRSRRCKSPVYHFVISWTPEETPSPDIMRAIVADTCKDLQLDDYQRLAIAHDDTHHKHVHVVVNRINPDTGKAWNRAQDWVRLEQSLARQAKARGLRYVPGRHNAPADGIHHNKRAKDTELRRSLRKGLPLPLKQWSNERLAAEKKQLADVFDNAGNWTHLHDALAKRGLSIKQKGQGHVLFDGHSEVKLSKISRTARITLLEKRFNEAFLPHTDVQIHKHAHTRSLPPNQRIATDAKPTAPDVKTGHPQLKSPTPPFGPPSEIDQPTHDRQHTVSLVTPRISNAPQPLKPKPKRHRRRGPKL